MTSHRALLSRHECDRRQHEAAGHLRDEQAEQRQHRAAVDEAGDQGEQNRDWTRP